MKNLIFGLIFTTIIFKLSAQPVLTFDNFGLKGGDKYTVSESNTFTPGMDGKTAIWDFLDLSCHSDRTVKLENFVPSIHNNLFSNANTTVIEDENSFFFQVDNNSNKLLGFRTPDALIRYDKPIVRTPFPFSFGDYSTTNYSGTGLYYNVVETHIWGTFQAHADAWGTLILPGGLVVNKVLRVKTEDHVFESGCTLFQTTNTKYMWYSEDFRYPILVVNQRIRFDGKDTTITNSTYYNETAAASLVAENMSLTSEISTDNSLFSVFPNPYQNEFHISYNLKKTTRVSIEIVNTLGVTLLTLVDNQEQNGAHDYLCNSSKIGRGTLFVKIIFGNSVFMRKLIRID